MIEQIKCLYVFNQWFEITWLTLWRRVIFLIFFRSIDSARIFRECVSLDLVYLLRWSDQFKTVVQINTKWTIIYTFIATIWTYDFVSYVLLRAFC